MVTCETYEVGHGQFSLPKTDLKHLKKWIVIVSRWSFHGLLVH